ncbi:MAG: hypothetical protein U1E45_16500 [Geminicoccaceae bacterium]
MPDPETSLVPIGNGLYVLDDPAADERLMRELQPLLDEFRAAATTLRSTLALATETPDDVDTRLLAKVALADVLTIDEAARARGIEREVLVAGDERMLKLLQFTDQYDSRISTALH